jgi:hypothetical protein
MPLQGAGRFAGSCISSDPDLIFDLLKKKIVLTKKYSLMAFYCQFV